MKKVKNFILNSALFVANSKNPKKLLRYFKKAKMKLNINTLYFE